MQYFTTKFFFLNNWPNFAEKTYKLLVYSNLTFLKIAIIEENLLTKKGKKVDWWTQGSSFLTNFIFLKIIFCTWMQLNHLIYIDKYTQKGLNSLCKVRFNEDLKILSLNHTVFITYINCFILIFSIFSCSGNFFQMKNIVINPRITLWKMLRILVKII